MVRSPFRAMYNDQIVVDDLIAEIADAKSIYHEVAVETLKRLCLESCEAYGYLQDRVLDSQLSECTQRQLCDVLVAARIRLNACQECTQACQVTPQHERDAFNYVLRRHCVTKIC